MKKEISDNANITTNSKQLEVLKEHFPNCFDKDGAFLPSKLEELVKETGADISREGYTLNWLGKSYASLLANENVRTLLAANTEHNAKPENANSENLLIQGDNLEVLKHLKNAYREKVKMIYIDPPYNTGSDGFVYADDRKFTPDQLSQLAGIDEDEAKRILEFTQSKSNSHSAWLTFMFPRLYIARELLREDGVIFISIDDNEQAQLKLLCDEVFGEENFLDNMIWKKRYGGGAKEKFLVSLQEYFLVYAKNLELLPEITVPLDEKSIARYYKLSDENEASRGKFRTHPLEATKSMDSRPNLIFPITAPDGTEINPKRQWLWSKKRVEDALQNSELHFYQKDGQWVVHTKQYLKLRNGEIRTTKAQNFIDDIYTQHGTNELIDIFGNASFFPFPKPIGVLKRIIEIGFKENNEVILDFFSGSGTTAHAVMMLNAEDGGNRKCISVQLDELTDEKSEAHKAGYKTIFEITRERIKRAAAKIKEESPEAKCDFGFKEFKTIEPFEGYLDEAETLDQYDAFEADKLSDEERGQLMLTWQVYDGLPLHMDLTPIDLAGYTAHQGNELLYFMDAGLELKHMVNLLERIDSDAKFAPRKLVVFGQLLSSKAQREISEAINSYNNRKGIELTLDIRF